MNIHPDRQAIDDWALYGPKNARIAEAVRELALRHDLRVADIESHIEAGLRDWLNVLDAAKTANRGDSAMACDLPPGSSLAVM